MKVSALKTERRVESSAWRGYGIQAYGRDNDYPQRLMEIAGASITGASCIRILASFIEGRGFAGGDFFSAVVNRKGETADDVLAKVAWDKAHFGGFALHVNWNMAGQVTEVYHVPFECLRLGLEDRDETRGKVAYHPDWGKRETALHTFKQSDIKWFDRYDPEKVREQAKREGWKNWKGQVLYWTGGGKDCYPVPVYDAAVTDMSTEEGLSNVSLRNVRSNYLPSGIFIDHNNEAESDEQQEETIKELKEFQGDTNAGKLLYFNIKDGEQEPEFKPFQTGNTDKEYVNTEENIPQRIGRAFSQPPILRAEDVGANFGADLMHNAYDFYNSFTETERMEVERVFAEVFSRFAENVNPDGDYTILPKRYRVNETLADRLKDSTDKVLELLYDGTKNEEGKRAVMRVIYGIDEDDIDELINAVRG